MLVFLTEWAYVLFCLGALSLAGRFILRPFYSPERTFLWLACPLAGIGALSLALTLGYFANLPFNVNLPLSFAICAALSGWSLFKDLRGNRSAPWRSLVVPALLILFCSALSVIMLEETTLLKGSPGLLYMLGTDAAGYAHVADWLKTHTHSHPPVLSPDRPYESWPYLCLTEDTRFGTFLLLATASVVRNLSCTFSYDFFSAVGLCAGCLAIAGAFGRSYTGLLLTVAGLCVSSWYDLSRSGYLGKILAYPSAILLVSLIVNGTQLQARRFAALAALTVGTCLLHTGLSVAFLCGLAGTGLYVRQIWMGTPLVVTALRSHDKRLLKEIIHPQIVELAFVGFVCGIAWFLLTPWIELQHVPITNTWRWLLCEGQDLIYLQPTIDSGMVLFRVLAPVILAQGSLALMALSRRQFASAGLIASGFTTFFMFWCLKSRYPLMQSVGMFFPLAVVGSVRFFEDCKDKPWFYRTAILALMLLMFGERVPRLSETMDVARGAAVPSFQRFSANTVNGICDTIGSRTVELRLWKTYRAEIMMVEMGRRGMSFQLDAGTWRTLLGYRGWTQPQGTPQDFILALSELPVNDPGTRIVFDDGIYKLLVVESK